MFKNVAKEMKLVEWPKGKELAKATGTVVSTVVLAAVFFAAADTLIAEAIKFFVSL